jgi:hypothetical protein
MYPYSDILDPIIAIIIGLIILAIFWGFIAIFAMFKFIAMLSTLVCIGMIGFILISIFLSEKKISSIEYFPFQYPEIKKFLFGKMNGDEFKDHCIVLFPFTILFLFGIYGLDFWINLFNYKSSFFANEWMILRNSLNRLPLVQFEIEDLQSIIDGRSTIGRKSIIYFIFFIIPYFFIGLIRFIWTSSANISQKEKEETDKFYSSIFSSFFSSMYSGKSKKKKHSEKSKKKDDVESRLEKLKKLLDDNQISKEEYEEQRKKIIGDV